VAATPALLPWRHCRTGGPGRSVAWHPWARVNEVEDADFRVRRGKRERFLATAQRLCDIDDALDQRRWHHPGQRLAGNSCAASPHRRRRARLKRPLGAVDPGIHTGFRRPPD
jgi:hypothetical protein